MQKYRSIAVIDEHIEELMCPSGANLFSALVTMERAKKFGLPPGLILVVDQRNQLMGTLTDGDVRRALMRGQTGQVPVDEIMARRPVSVRTDIPVSGVLREVRHQIEALGKPIIKYPILVDEENRVLGIIDLSKFMLAEAWNWDKIAIIGMGYAGLTLALSLADVGFQVVGWDADPNIRATLQKGISHVYEHGLESLLTAQLADGRLMVPDSDSAIKDCHAYIITVSTPCLDGVPNLSLLRRAVETTSCYLRTGDLVVLRSTVPVGTCRTLVRETLEVTSSLKVGPEIGIAFAPERTVEGRALEELRTLPQVIGGFDRWSLESASRIFNRLTSTVVQMKSLEEAELVKLINNVSRDLSFAFANEIALICEQYNHDAFRVIEAANLGYPRNPIASPSPGVGGSCLKKDPYFLSSLCPPDLPDLASVGRRINEMMPEQVYRRVTRALKEMGKELGKVRLFVLGFAFKGEPETTDLRDSPTLQIVELFRPQVDAVMGFDPIVPRSDLEAIGIEWRSIDDGFSQVDAVLFMNNHRDFSKLDVYKFIRTMKLPGIFFDGWHIFNPENIETIEDVRYMGLGYLTPWSKE